MSEVRKIECPSCGSNSTFKLPDGDYRCNYCQSNFKVKDPDDWNDRANTTTTTHYTFTTVVPARKTASSKSKVIVIIATIVLMFGISFAVFLKNMATSPPDATNGVTAIHTTQSVRSTAAFIGSRGASIWIVTKDSVLIIDAQKHTLLTQLPLDEKMETGFFAFGDTAYNINDDKKLVGYNIYTGLVVVNDQSLGGQFPELKAGILKAGYTSSKHTFKITTTNGDEFRYDPVLQQLAPGDEPHKKRKDYPVTTELFLSGGLKHQMCKLTKQGDGFPVVMNGYLQESLVAEIKPSKSTNIQDIFGNKRVEKVSDKNYFRAQPLVKDDEHMVLLYKTDLSDKAQVILESVNAEGNTNWSLTDPLFSAIGKAFASDDLGCGYTNSKEVLILEIPSEEIIYIGIDLKSGKKLWTFNVTTYLQ